MTTGEDDDDPGLHRDEAAYELDRDTIEATARNDETVIKYLEDKTVVKVIVVPGKLVNIVVK